MNRVKRFTQLFIGVLLLSLTSFQTVVANDDTAKDDRLRALLNQIAEKAIVPMYEEFADASKQLNESSTAFCKSPNKDSFQQIKTHWGAALSHWQQTDALLFGPAIEDQIDFGIYFLPTKKKLVKKALKEGSVTDAASLDAIGVGGQGFGSLEYLLFDRDQDTKAMLEKFIGDNGKVHCDYLQAATTLIQQHADTIQSGWKNGYADAFSTAGKGSAEFLEANQPLEILVNKMFQTTEKVTGKKLGIPLDKKREGKHVNAHKLEAWRSGHTLANMQANILGLKRLIVEGGMFDWLKENDKKDTANKLNEQLNALVDYSFESNDLFSLLKSDKTVAEDFYQKSKTLTSTIKRELAPAMGVQLGFNDNDGD